MRCALTISSIPQVGVEAWSALRSEYGRLRLHCSMTNAGSSLALTAHVFARHLGSSLGAFTEAHHDSIAIIWRSTQALLDLGLILDFDAARLVQLPRRRSEVGLDLRARGQAHGRDR